MTEKARRQILTSRHKARSADHPIVSEDGGGPCTQVEAPRRVATYCRGVEKGQGFSDTPLKSPGLLLQIRSDYNTVNAVGRIMAA